MKTKSSLLTLCALCAFVVNTACTSTAQVPPANSVELKQRTAAGDEWTYRSFTPQPGSLLSFGADRVPGTTAIATFAQAGDLSLLSSTVSTIQTQVATNTGALAGLDTDLSNTAALLTAHTGNTNNPHAVTKAQVDLANADNTSDAAKPLSTAAAAALAARLDKVTGSHTSPRAYTVATNGAQTMTVLSTNGAGNTIPLLGAAGQLTVGPASDNGHAVPLMQLNTGLATKQNVLVSGTTIKTINGESLLGPGNITVTGGGGGFPITGTAGRIEEYYGQIYITSTEQGYTGAVVLRGDDLHLVGRNGIQITAENGQTSFFNSIYGDGEGIYISGFTDSKWDNQTVNQGQIVGSGSRVLYATATTAGVIRVGSGLQISGGTLSATGGGGGGVGDVPAGGAEGQLLAKASSADHDLIWINPPSSLWVQSGNNIYYTAGNVGIGTSSPAAALHVAEGKVLFPNGSVIAGQAPGIAFSSYGNTGFGANSGNLAVWLNGKIATNITSSEFRMASDVTVGFSSASNNNAVTDTRFGRAAAGSLYTPGKLRVGSSAAAAYPLDVAGDINLTGDIRKNGVVWNPAGGGSGRFSQVEYNTTVDSNPNVVELNPVEHNTLYIVRAMMTMEAEYASLTIKIMHSPSLVDGPVVARVIVIGRWPGAIETANASLVLSLPGNDYALSEWAAEAFVWSIDLMGIEGPAGAVWAVTASKYTSGYDWGYY